MTKRELMAVLAKKEGITDKQASGIVKLFFDRFGETLMKGDRIEIRGFGTFSVREYKAYEGRNPKTGAEVAVHPKRLPFFKAGMELKKLVDK